MKGLDVIILTTKLVTQQRYFCIQKLIYCKCEIQEGWVLGLILPLKTSVKSGGGLGNWENGAKG